MPDLEKPEILTAKGTAPSLSSLSPQNKKIARLLSAGTIISGILWCLNEFTSVRGINSVLVSRIILAFLWFLLVLLGIVVFWGLSLSRRRLLLPFWAVVWVFLLLMMDHFSPRPSPAAAEGPARENHLAVPASLNSNTSVTDRNSVRKDIPKNPASSAGRLEMTPSIRKQLTPEIERQGQLLGMPMGALREHIAERISDMRKFDAGWSLNTNWTAIQNEPSIFDPNGAKKLDREMKARDAKFKRVERDYKGSFRREFPDADDIQQELSDRCSDRGISMQLENPMDTDRAVDPGIAVRTYADVLADYLRKCL